MFWESLNDGFAEGSICKFNIFAMIIAAEALSISRLGPNVPSGKPDKTFSLLNNQRTALPSQ